MDRDFYKILQVDPEADPEVIAAAHRALSGRLHPETDLTGVHEVRLAEINRAYDVLRDPAQRRAYDVRRAADLVPMGPGDDHGDHESSGVSLSERVASRSLDAAGARGLTIDFGRYAGWTLGDLIRSDPDYLRWLSRHSSGIRFRGPILRLLAELDGRRSYVRSTTSTER